MTQTTPKPSAPFRRTLDARSLVARVGIPLLAAASLCGCRRTDVLVAPHAPPFRSSSGVVVNRGPLRSNLSVGVIASNDGRTDVTWRLRDGGRTIWACLGGRAKSAATTCRQATFVGGEPLKDAIRFLAPPVTRAATVASPAPPTPTVEPDQTTGAALDEQAAERDAIPDHGIWVTGKVRFLQSGLFHCIVDERRPVCTKVAGSILPFVAFSRHIVVRNGTTQDVLWATPLITPNRCYRAGSERHCQPATYANP